MRTAEYDIEGYGPVTVRRLTRAQVKANESEARKLASRTARRRSDPEFVALDSDEQLEVSRIAVKACRGLVSPRPSEAEMDAEFGHRPAVLGAIVDAIDRAGWPTWEGLA